MTERSLNDQPDFSVVICTRNRANALEACLQSVAAIAYAGPWEIVLVDNGAIDAIALTCAAGSESSLGASCSRYQPCAVRIRLASGSMM